MSETLDLPESVRAQIDRTFPPRTDVVEAGSVRRDLRATGDSSEFCVAEYRTDGLAVAPPLFAHALAQQPSGTPPPGEDGLGGILESYDAEVSLRRAVVAG